MWFRRKGGNRGPAEFFWIGLSQHSLVEIYRTNFALMHHHKYSLTELENMIPWERDIYLTLLVEYIASEEERRRESG